MSFLENAYADQNERCSMMERHLIVVSIDAMVYEDLDFLNSLPCIGRLIRQGSLIRKNTTVYPSLTHTVHASLISGCTPGHTGVISNEHFVLGESSSVWYNNLSEIKCDTLIHGAKRAGLTTCACRWPVTSGKDSVVDWLVPEVLDYEIMKEPDPEKLYRLVCAPSLFDEIIRPNLSMLSSKERHPAYDAFEMKCASDIIRKYKPNLLLTHPGMVDHCRHESGLFSPLVNDALRMTDEWIGWLIDAVKDAGIEESTSYAIISDHGHLEYVRTIALNVLFAQKGLLSVNPDGSLGKWRVFAKSCGLSAQVYVNKHEDERFVEQQLREMALDGLFGFDEVLNREQCRERYGTWGDFAFMIEGDGCTAFTSKWTGPLIRKQENAKYGKHSSSHGHMPEKGPQPPMIVYGPAFRRGVVLENGNILDEAPTFAAALGFTLPEADGKPVIELLS